MNRHNVEPEKPEMNTHYILPFISSSKVIKLICDERHHNNDCPWGKEFAESEESGGASWNDENVLCLEQAVV